MRYLWNAGIPTHPASVCGGSQATGQSPGAVTDSLSHRPQVISQLALFLYNLLMPLLDKWYPLGVTWKLHALTPEKCMYELLHMVNFPNSSSLQA